MMVWRDKSTKTGKSVGIVIGRFQPFHKGHLKILERVFKDNDVVVIVIGSAQAAPTIKNPWSDHDRVAMISGCIQSMAEGKRVEWVSVRDHPYNLNAWMSELKIKTSKVVASDDFTTIYGHDKDSSTFYLNLFPEWQFIDVGELSDGIDATTIRKFLFGDATDFFLKKNLPSSVYNHIVNIWMESERYTNLVDDYDFIHGHDDNGEHVPGYKETYGEGPHTAVDAVVTYPGKVLVVKRKAMPGRGLYAMPGGFLKDPYEPLLDAAMRVVLEKSGIELMPHEFKNARVFDNPGRSQRARIISHTHRFEVGSDFQVRSTRKEFAKGGEAIWIDIADLSLYSEMFFEDHGHILQEMTK